MMIQLSPDDVQLLIRERLQWAANDALARQASSGAERSANDDVTTLERLRLRLALGLRGLALRLDPSLACEPCLAATSTAN